MKDRGEADIILGIKITIINNEICLSQPHYVDMMLNRFGQANCKPISTPCKHLKQNRGIVISQKEYVRIIGSLMYLTNSTRLDITYVVNRLSR